MHQTKKGQQWYFGMKAHLGVDSRSKLIHSVAATAANVHDSQALPWLLHGDERRVAILPTRGRPRSCARAHRTPKTSPITKGDGRGP
jgi:IS5 family transposase